MSARDDADILLEARIIKEDPLWYLDTVRTICVFTGVEWEDVEYEEPDTIEMLSYIGWSDDE